MKLPPSPVRRLNLAVVPPPTSNPARPQLALTVSSESTVALQEFEEAQIARIKQSHADANLKRREAERKRGIFESYRRPAAKTHQRIWRACKRTNGGHTFIDLTRRGSWVEGCKHCEMPKEAKARQLVVSDYTKRLMIDEVVAGNLNAEDLNWSIGYEDRVRIDTALRARTA